MRPTSRVARQPVRQDPPPAEGSIFLSNLVIIFKRGLGVLLQRKKEGKGMRIQFEPYASFTPMLYINMGIDSHIFVPFKHTMDVYVKDASQQDLMWNFVDGLSDDRNYEEEFRNYRRIRDWEFIIDLDSRFAHGTQISLCARTIHGFRFEVSSPKNYRDGSNIGSSFSHLEFSTRMREDEVLEIHSQVLELIESMKSINCTKTRDVDIRLRGTISVYKLDKFQYSHAKGVVPYSEESRRE